MPIAPLPVDVFTLAYEDVAGLLVGRWLRSTPEVDLYPSYEQLLAAALAHGQCRYWLLDMRRRAWHSASFDKWYGDLLANQVVKKVGTPVFVAYVADESHRADIESTTTQATLLQVAQVEFYPHFFHNEADAREWLTYYRTHAGEEPAGAAG